MKVFNNIGKEVALFAKNSLGKSVLVASDFDGAVCQSDEMAAYVSDELGDDGIVYYSGEM
jgi:hypothetical protein